MGKVSKAIENLVTKQIQDHGIVVWYDPEQVYTDLVSRLELPKTTILKFDGSFFELRYRMEPLLEFVDEKENLCTDTGIPPRLLVYVPMDRASTHYALIEAEAAGVIMQLVIGLSPIGAIIFGPAASVLGIATKTFLKVFVLSPRQIGT